MSSDRWNSGRSPVWPGPESDIQSVCAPLITRRPGLSSSLASTTITAMSSRGSSVAARHPETSCRPGNVSVPAIPERAHLPCSGQSQLAQQSITQALCTSTPTYSSWLNLIEAQFTALKSFCLSNSDDLTHKERRGRIYRYLNARNREQAKPHCHPSIYRR